MFFLFAIQIHLSIDTSFKYRILNTIFFETIKFILKYKIGKKINNFCLDDWNDISIKVFIRPSRKKNHFSFFPFLSLKSVHKFYNIKNKNLGANSHRWGERWFGAFCWLTQNSVDGITILKKCDQCSLKQVVNFLFEASPQLACLFLRTSKTGVGII